jgi:hypothetical protein
LPQLTNSSAETGTVELPDSRARFSVERAWIGAIVGYSVLRFVVAWGAMGEYGVNPWVFGVIDVGTAWPYAKSTAGMVKAGWGGRWMLLAQWSVVALVTFFAPYLYLWSAGNGMPDSLEYGLGLVVAVLFVAASLGIVRKIKSGPTS